MGQTDHQWKDKYLQSLAELEEREKQWGDIEFALRKCISRLSFIGDGRDKLLDSELETLRNRVRGEKDLDRLNQMIENITHLSDEISATAALANPEQLATKLLPMLESPPLPPELRREGRALARKLKKGPFSTELFSQWSELITRGLTEIGGESSGNRGLFSKLFNKEESVNQEPESENSGSSLELSGFQSKTTIETDGKADIHETTREVLSLLVRKLNDVEGWTQPVMPFLGRIDQSDTATALFALTEELTELIANSQKRQPSEKYPAAEVNGRDASPVIPAEEALLQLLDLIEENSDDASLLAQLRRQLQRGIHPRQLPDVLDQFAAMVGRQRQRAEEERQEVERFLLQLTERLQALDSEVSGVGQRGQEIIDSNRSFGESVEGEMSDFHAHVAAATDLNDLKFTISERIAVIQDRLRDHRQQEQARADQLETNIGQLKQRLSSVEQETESLKERIKEAKKKALKDALTGMNNRMAFDARMTDEYERWSRYAAPMSLIVLDIDDFKKINDTYGHKAGDKVLKVVGGLLNKQVRKADFSARYGGEEFVVLLPETTREAAVAVAEKIRETIAGKGFHSGDQLVTVTISSGVAQFQSGDTEESAFKRADEALYLAKKRGKNQVCTETDLE